MASAHASKIGEKYSEPVSALVQKLGADRQNPKYSDLVLKCGTEGRSFRVHRCVVGVSVPFFDQMFQADMKEANASEIDISTSDPQNIVSPESLGLVIDMVYGHEICINLENVCGLHSAANFFGLTKLACRCLKYLNEHITRQNVFDMWKYSETVFPGAKTLYEKVQHYLRDNFSAISRRKEFLSLEWGEVKRIVTMEKLVLYFKNDVLNALMSWILFDWPSRYQIAEAVLEEVDWRKIDIASCHLMQCMENFEAKIASDHPETAMVMKILQKLLGPSRKRQIEPHASNSETVCPQTKKRRLRQSTLESFEKDSSLKKDSSKLEVVYFCSKAGYCYYLNVFDTCGDQGGPHGSFSFPWDADRICGVFAFRKNLHVLTYEPECEQAFSVCLHKMEDQYKEDIHSSHKLQVTSLPGNPARFSVGHFLINEKYFGLVVEGSAFRSHPSVTMLLLYRLDLLESLEDWKVLPCSVVIDDPNFLHFESPTRARYVLSGDTVVSLGLDYRTEAWKELRIYDMETMAWGVGPLPYNDVVKPTDEFECISGNGRLYAIGFHRTEAQPSSWARYLEIGSSEWKDLPFLRTGRLKPKLGIWNGQLHAFGGYGRVENDSGFKRLLSREMLDLSNVSSGWQMKPFKLYDDILFASAM